MRMPAPKGANLFRFHNLAFEASMEGRFAALQRHFARRTTTDMIEHLVRIGEWVAKRQQEGDVIFTRTKSGVERQVEFV